MKMAIDVTENMSCPSDLQLQSFSIKLLGYFQAAQL
jgi:hypothetical protein